MKKYSKLRGLITFIVVIIGISAIGWFIWNTGHIFVSLVTEETVLTNQTDTGSGNEETEEILTLPPIKFWTCQAGVFNDKNNALKIRDELRTKGWKAELLTDSSNMVVVGYFPFKEDAKEFSTVLQEQGVNNFIKEMDFPALKFKVRGKSSNVIVQILDLSNRILRGENLADLAMLERAVNTAATGSPLSFAELNNCLQEIVNKSSKQEEYATFNQDLLNLYMQYCENTVKYLNNPKEQGVN